MRLLVVEDEKDLNDIITKRLKKASYAVDSCFDGEEALAFIMATTYDGIILDIMLPKLDGFKLVELIRSKNINTPVLFLSAKDAIEDRVKGLDLGANDYLVKPFAFEELLARIRVLLRKGEVSASMVLKVGDLELDTSSHQVKRANNIIKLSSKEYALLEYLMRNENIVLSREKIENSLWSFEYEGGSNAVDVYIRYLRKKIDDGYPVKLIHTIRGSGYVMRVEL